MSKRFTDTEKWEDPWYMDLPNKYKLLWQFILDKCDNVGIWKTNNKLAQFHIDNDFDFNDFLEKADGRIEIIKEDTWLILNFCDFQYGLLSSESRPHQSYIKLIKKHGIESFFKDLITNQSNSIASKRKRLTKKFKSRILQQDNYLCQYCGVEGTIIDHIIPLVNGGTNEEDNLTTICSSCNSKKSDSNPIYFIERNNIKPLDSLSKKLYRVCNILDTPKEKEKEKETEKDKEQEGVSEAERKKFLEEFDIVSINNRNGKV